MKITWIVFDYSCNYGIENIKKLVFQLKFRSSFKPISLKETLKWKNKEKEKEKRKKPLRNYGGSLLLRCLDIIFESPKIH